MVRIYSRDSRSPIPLNDDVSKKMSSIKAKNTQPELIVRRALRTAGYPGYRKYWDVEGRPDIAYPGRKIAIFINGCYWHRCPKCNLPLPKNNTEYWKNKFERNVTRDQKKRNLLEEDGWLVIVVWECEIKHSLDNVVRSIVASIETR